MLTQSPIPTVPGAPAAFHLLAKPTGAICNLDCEYCFFLSKEMLYPGSRFRMADELLETYVRQLIEAHAGSPEVTVAWQGGEPTLMGVDFFRRSVELAEKYRLPAPADHLHDPDERRRSSMTNGRRSSSEHGRPRRRLDRRPQGDPRRVPRRQGRARAASTASWPGSPSPGARRRMERADHDPRGQPGPRQGGLPVPARRVRRPVHPVHPDRRTGDLRDALDRERGMGRGREGPTSLHAGGQPGDRAVDLAGGVRPVPHRRVRGVGAPRRRRGLRPDVRRRAGELARASRRACACTRRPAGWRSRSSTPATSTRATTSSSPTTSSATSRTRTCSSCRARRSSGSSGWTSATRCPVTASSATCGSPATAAAPRTASRDAGRRARTRTTCARASRRSSTTSTSRCGRWAICCRRGGRRPRSCAVTRPRTRSAGATTSAPAVQRP